MDLEIAMYLRKIIEARSQDKDRSLEARMAYNSCLDMIDYAIKGSWECLTQFDDVIED